MMAALKAFPAGSRQADVDGHEAKSAAAPPHTRRFLGFAFLSAASANVISMESGFGDTDQVICINRNARSH